MPTKSKKPKKKKKLVIVESPTKAKTISRFLGSDFSVESSFGHVRDLPKSEMGIDTEHDFTPRYVIPRSKQKKVTALKKSAKNAEHIYFATDEDREGEAIAWHLSQIIDASDDQTSRITFHEITKSAITKALEHPRPIDINLVDAQQARRILDRLVGYTLSPFLWKKIAKGLSAGRVQSVSMRMIVEREKEIEVFVPREYWTVEADLLTPRSHNFSAKLVSINGEKLDKFAVENSKQAEEMVGKLNESTFIVSAVDKKRSKKSPPAPYTTSTLQQDANRKLGFSARQTMMLAQQLYEGIDLGGSGTQGLITYMRTDSRILAASFTESASEFLKKTYGDKYHLESPRVYKTKSKGAQEAHEAIRPTDVTQTPESIKSNLDSRQWKLYDLIWRRAVASQMPEAELESTGIDVAASCDYTLRATGTVVAFDGFLKLLPETQKDILLPEINADEEVEAEEILPKQHFTEPPARYSDASLVKALEEHGIGRPSTYAPTIATIIDRGYVERIDRRRLKPTDIGRQVNDLLVEHFPNVVDYAFTAKMEESLDEIADGKQTWKTVIGDFYKPYAIHLEKKEKEIEKKIIPDEPTDLVCEKCGKPMVIKTGRFGKFYACTGFPKCKNTKPYHEDGEEPEPEITNEKCGKCGKPMEIVEGRYGKYLRCTGNPDCDGKKSIQKSTGVKCPKCGEGDIVEKRTKRGKIFYACNQYPKCDQAYWQKPTGEKCKKCDNPLLFAAKGKIKCSNKECDFEKTAE